MLHLLNLSSKSLVDGPDPWDFKAEIPPNIRTDKKARDAWINHPGTVHYVYSLVEGVNANLRVSQVKADGSGNPAHSAFGLAADYDAPQEEAAVLRMASAMPIPPNWIERTLSGHWRFVWLFEKPIKFPSHEFAIHFLERFSEFAFKPAMGMLGFDEGAWTSPERLYTNGCDWRPLNPNKIPASITSGWLVQASQTFKFSDSNIGLSIPLEVIAPELAKRFPSFSQWPEEFTLGSQGPTFWVPESSSPKSAIVRETGMQTFSDHAPKAFYPWMDLLGVAFCKQFETEAAGRAVEGIYFDGKYYWHEVANKWNSRDRSDITLHLRTVRGISPKSDKSGVSAIDKALSHIQDYKSIAGAAPFAFRPPGIITINNVEFLNTSVLRVMQPAPGPAIWGPLGNFPWISEFYGRFFSNEIQLDFMLSWLSVYYKSGFHGQPAAGQACFVAGPEGVGKTLHSTEIVGPLVGGVTDAGDYLLGKDAFGSELFEKPLWTVDDGVSSADRRTHRIFSEMVKRTTANSTFRYHAKFKNALMVEWLGRIMISLNCDEESIRKLPDLDISIRKKLMLFRTAEKTVVFPERHELKKILARELPPFARYLLDWQIPEHCKGESRYIVKHYHEPSLVESARLSSATAGFAEILEDWKDEYFCKREKGADFWEGTAYQLHKSLLLDPTAEHAMRRFDVDAIGRCLSTLKSKGAKIECSNQGESRVWKIFKT